MNLGFSSFLDMSGIEKMGHHPLTYQKIGVSKISCKVKTNRINKIARQEQSKTFKVTREEEA